MTKSKMEMRDLLGLRQSEDRMNFLSLSKVKKIDEFSGNEKRALEVLYESKELNNRLFGVLLNSSLVQNRLYWICGYESFVELIKTDVNIGRETLNGTEYRKFITHMLVENYIEVVKKSPGIPYRISTVYRWKHKEIKKLIKLTNTDYHFRKQREDSIRVFEEKLNTLMENAKKLTTGEPTCEITLDNKNENKSDTASKNAFVEQEPYLTDSLLRKISRIDSAEYIYFEDIVGNQLLILLGIEIGSKIGKREFTKLIQIFAIWLTIKGKDVEDGLINETIKCLLKYRNFDTTEEEVRFQMSTALENTCHIIKTVEMRDFLIEENRRYEIKAQEKLDNEWQD